MNGHEQVVNILINAGADATIPDQFGELPLNYAEFRGHDDSVNILVKKSVKPNSTPKNLIEAIEQKDLNQLVLLLNAGISPNEIVGNSYPLHFSLRQRRTECVPLLLKAGANPNLRSKGSTCLHIAADKGLDAAVKYLLKHGSDINAKNEKNGNTPLHFAISKGKVSTITLLMANGADPLIMNHTGINSLTLCMGSNDHDLLNAMLDGGLLKKVPADVVLNESLHAHKCGLSFRLTLMTRKNLSILYDLDRILKPVQVRVITERYPDESLRILKNNVEMDHPYNCWEVLDAL